MRLTDIAVANLMKYKIICV